MPNPMPGIVGRSDAPTPAAQPTRLETRRRAHVVSIGAVGTVGIVDLAARESDRTPTALTMPGTVRTVSRRQRARDERREQVRAARAALGSLLRGGAV